MERSIQYYRWTNCTKKEVDMFTNEHLDRGGKVTIMPEPNKGKEITYEVRVEITESTLDYILKLNQEIDKTTKLVGDCGKKHEEYVSRILSIRRHMSINKSLKEKYLERKKKAEEILYTISKTNVNI